ncbi:hypothetical protein MASR2M29_12370 [Spirochaetota bacterium]
MASFGKQRIMGRVIVLIILIVAIAIGGLFWFDYLGLLDAKAFFSPVLRLVKIPTRSGQSLPEDLPSLLIDERLAKRLEAMEIMRTELAEQEKTLQEKQAAIEAMAIEVDDRAKDLEEKEISLRQVLNRYENRKENIEQNAKYLTSMPPADAVKILEASDDQTVIDTLRAVEELALKAGEASLVPFWLSKMDSDRAARLQRKMSEKPISED